MLTSLLRVYQSEDDSVFDSASAVCAALVSEEDELSKLVGENALIVGADGTAMAVECGLAVEVIEVVGVVEVL